MGRDRGREKKVSEEKSSALRLYRKVWEGDSSVMKSDHSHVNFLHIPIPCNSTVQTKLR